MANDKITEVPFISDSEKATAVVPVVSDDSPSGDWRKVLFSQLVSLALLDYQTGVAYPVGSVFAFNRRIYRVAIAIAATNTAAFADLPTGTVVALGGGDGAGFLAYAGGTAYPVNTFVYDPTTYHLYVVTTAVPSTNTDRPAANSSFQPLGLTAAQVQALIDVSRAFASRPIGTWLKHVSSDPPTSGDFSTTGVEDDLRINKTDADGNDRSAVLEAIEVGQALTFGADGFTFVIETRQLNEPTYIEWTGYWADARADDNIEDTRVAVGHIPHRVDMTGLLNERYRALPRELEEETEAREAADDRLEDLTVDVHLQDDPGAFANVTDSAVAGIALTQNTAAARAALAGGTFNFGSVTWMNPSADIPDDGNDYWVLVRVAESLGNIETEFRLLSDDSEAPEEHLRRSRQADATWNYYAVVADTESVWTLQRRGTNTHTRWDGRLGDPALAQVDERIPESGGPGGAGLTDIQRDALESARAKTADLSIISSETWANAGTGGIVGLGAGITAVVNLGNGQAPSGVSGWSNNITTTTERVIVARVAVDANIADYRVLFADGTWETVGRLAHLCGGYDVEVSGGSEFGAYCPGSTNPVTTSWGGAAY